MFLVVFLFTIFDNPPLRDGSFLAAYAADGRILVIHGDVEQVVQLAEDALLSKLGDASEKDRMANASDLSMLTHWLRASTRPAPAKWLKDAVK